MILDVFSRYAVGWTVQHRESAELAKALIAQATAQQAIEPGTLTVRADRGSSMTSKPVVFLLADLGVLKTHSRPYTSTDNPYSEAQFKTLKYRPGFPARFDSIEHARPQATPPSVAPTALRGQMRLCPLVPGLPSPGSCRAGCHTDLGWQWRGGRRFGAGG